MLGPRRLIPKRPAQTFANHLVILIVAMRCMGTCFGKTFIREYQAP